MDVTCERCGTEYEFDETLVSDRGTTVKCTNCGHLFKVFRRGAEPSRADESTKIWQLRMASGETQAFGSLKELQRLIAEGKVSEDDKLARAGEGWKRLGDIAELSTFFAAARPAKKPTPAAPGVPPKPPGKGTMMGMGGARKEAADYQPAATRQAAVPPPAVAPPRPKPSPPGRPAPPPAPDPEPPPRRPAPRTDQTMKGIGSGGRQSYEEIGSNDAISEPAIPPPARTPAPPAARAPESDPPPPPPPRRRQEERRPDSRRPPAVRQLQLDDEEAPAAVPRRNLTPVWLGLVVLAVVGGGLFWAWPMIQGGGAGSQAPASPADRFITAGEAALARDRLAAYDDAADEFTKALAVDEASVRAQVGLARAHALQAQARLFEADDIEARAGDDAALRGEATALRRTAAEEAAEARTAAETVVRGGTGGAEAELVLADALRLVGERDLAQSRLGRAQTLAPGPNAEALRVQALLTAPPGAAGLASARDLAAQAVAADGELLRARLLLARASLAAGDGEAARREAEAVLARDGTHADALALRDRAMALIGSGASAPPVAPPATTTPVVAPPVTSTPTVAPPTTSTPAGGGESSSGGSTAPVARDYSALVREGEARLERGQTAAARQSFEAALRSRASGAEALTGLGYVLLNEGNAQGAARQFSSAASNGNGDALIGLGDAYRRLGQREQALEAYRRYLQILPSGSHASVARRQIDLLGGGSGGGGSGGGSGTGGGGSGTPPESGGSGADESGSGSGGSTGSGSGSAGGGGSGGGQLETPPTVTDSPAIESEP